MFTARHPSALGALMLSLRIDHNGAISNCYEQRSVPNFHGEVRPRRWNDFLDRRRRSRILDNCEAHRYRRGENGDVQTAASGDSRLIAKRKTERVRSNL
jgi:hypothetical protein